VTVALALRLAALLRYLSHHLQRLGLPASGTRSWRPTKPVIGSVEVLAQVAGVLILIGLWAFPVLVLLLLEGDWFFQPHPCCLYRLTTRLAYLIAFQ